MLKKVKPMEPGEWRSIAPIMETVGRFFGDVAKMISKLK